MIYSIKVIADGTTFTVGEKNPLDRMGLTTVESIVMDTASDYIIQMSNEETVLITNTSCYSFIKGELK